MWYLDINDRVTLSPGLLGFVAVINMEIFHLQEQKDGNKTLAALNLSPSKTFSGFIDLKSASSPITESYSIRNGTQSSSNYFDTIEIEFNKDMLLLQICVYEINLVILPPALWSVPRQK